MEKFNKKVHVIGRVSVAICLIAFVASALVLAWIYDSSVDINLAVKSAAPIILVFTIAGVSENLSYTPIIGPGALYISCITGNLSNIKIPAAINGQKLLDAEPGSEQADIISIIVVSVCTLVTTALMLMGMLFLAPLIEPIYNNPVIKPAFDNVLPALFGALIVPQLVGNAKISLPIFLLPAVIYIAIGGSMFQQFQGLILVACAVIGVVYALAVVRKKDSK